VIVLTVATCELHIRHLDVLTVGAEFFLQTRCRLLIDLRLVSVDKKNQLDVTFCILYFSSNICSTWLPETC